MKILVLSPFLPFPLDNGGAIRVYHILRELAQRNDVVLLCFGDMTTEAREALRFCRAVHVLPAPPFPRPWWQHVWALPGPIPASVCLPADAMRTHMHELFKTEKFDIVQIEFFGLAHLVPTSNGQKNVLVEHCVTSQLRQRQLRLMPWSLRRLYYTIDQLKLRRFERRVLSAIDACIAVSSTDEQTIRTLAPAAQVATVPNGVDTSYFTPGGAADPQSLLFVGAFHLDPANADGIVYFTERVLPLIRREHPHVTLTIVGPEPPPEVRRLASHPGVSVVGHVDDVRPYFTRASVLILPLRAGAGTKIRIYTSMAMGTPVVATPIAAEGMDARLDEEIVIADLPNEFADRVAALLEDPEGRVRLGRASREAANTRYDWRVSGRRLEEFYRSLVNSRAG